MERKSECEFDWVDEKVELTGGDIYMKCEEAINKLAEERGGDPVFWYFYGMDILTVLLGAIFNMEGDKPDEDKS